MSEEGMTVTVLANALSKALSADERHPDGCDVGAGLYGSEVSKLIRYVVRRMLGIEEPVPQKEAQIHTTQFEKWGAFELPVKTIKAFLESDAEDTAYMSFTKGEMKEYLDTETLKVITKFKPKE